MKKTVIILSILMFIVILFSDSSKVIGKTKKIPNKETKKNIDKSKLKNVKHRSRRKENKPKKRFLKEKTGAELIEYGWKQFSEGDYEHSSECFQELITRRDSLGEAYLGLGWSKLMLYEPIEETKILKSSDYVKNKELYAILPEDMYVLYNQNDDCPKGWVNNAVKLNEENNPVLINKLSMPYISREWIPLMVYVDSGVQNEEKKKKKTIEYDDVTQTEYDCIVSGTMDSDWCEYDGKSGIITITDDFIDYIEGDFNNYLIGTSYTRFINEKMYWTEKVVLTKDLGEERYKQFLGYVPAYVKIIKRRDQDHTTDTWDYQVFNLYDFSGDEYRLKELENNKYLLNEEAFSIDIYRIEPDSTKNRIVPGTEMTYLEYLRLDTNNDGEANYLDESLDLKENVIRFPFIKPFSGWIDDIYTTKESRDEMYLSLKIRYVDIKKQLEIFRLFSKSKKLLNNQDHWDTFYAGWCYLMTLQKYYFECINKSEELLSKKWEFSKNIEINYKSIIILRSYCFYKQNKLTESLNEIRIIEPDFNTDINQIKGVNDLYDKIEQKLLKLKIKIK